MLLFLWLITGISLRELSIPLLVLFALYLQNAGRHLYLYVLFFFTLILSDSRIYALSFSQDLKTFLMLLLLLPFVFPKRVNLPLDFSKSFHPAFVPFAAFAFFCIVFSPQPFTAFQKTLSYFLLFAIVPTIFYGLFRAYTTNFLKALIYLGVAVLVAGYLMYLINPSWVMYNAGNRSSGALGNPNGLGMFCLAFYLLYFTINYYFPSLISKRWNIIIHLLIFTSLIWSGSRGQTLAMIIFIVTQTLFKKNKVAGLLATGVVCLIFLLIEIDIVGIAKVLGFEDYLRVESLDEGGGRVVARQFAWEQIQKNFLIGKGFSYTEYIYKQHYWELSLLGHEGNAHNAFLTVWLDTGLIGLILYVLAWGILFVKAAKNSFIAVPLAFATIASNMVESWLTASLNPFTIQIVMILTILINIKDFSRFAAEKKRAIAS